MEDEIDVLEQRLHRLDIAAVGLLELDSLGKVLEIATNHVVAADDFVAGMRVRVGDEVVGCDNMIGGDLQNLPEGIEFKEADCGDVEAMKPLLENVDLVYHCGAIATEGLSVFSPAIIAKHVYENTAGLLAASASKRVKRFVYCSSMARYGKGKAPFSEDQPADPVDPYGIAKYAGELLVRNVSQTHGMEHVIAVPHNIIGPRQKYDDPYRNVASIMINRMLQGKQPIIYGDGEQQRSSPSSRTASIRF